jgi:rhodanese-related sulfurtransferase
MFRVNFIVENIFLLAIAFISGGMLVWPLVNKAKGGTQLDTLSATRLINDGAVVVDVRDTTEFSSGHLVNAKHIPVGEIDKRMGDIPSGKPVLVYCSEGNRSSKASAALKKAEENKYLPWQADCQLGNRLDYPLLNKLRKTSDEKN